MRLLSNGKRKIIYRMVFILCVLIVGVCFFLKHIGYRINNPVEYSQTIPDNLRDVHGYEEFVSISNKGAVIPGLTEGLIPQGICYIEERDVFLVTGYHKGGASSVISVIDKKNGLLIKNILLCNNDGERFCGHVGGIASDGKWVWISSEKSIYAISYEIIENASNMDSIFLSENIKCPVKADYIYYAESYLWVGEYSYAPFYKTDSSHYAIDSDGKEYNALVLEYSLSPEHDKIEKIERALYVPDRVQGIILQNDGSIILSCSFWCFEDSKLMCYFLGDDYHVSTVMLDDKEIPVFYLEDQYLVWELSVPSMSEGIAIADNNFYIIFENASLLYSWYSREQIYNIMIIPSESLYSKEEN